MRKYQYYSSIQYYEPEGRYNENRELIPSNFQE